MSVLLTSNYFLVTVYLFTCSHAPSSVALMYCVSTNGFAAALTYVMNKASKTCRNIHHFFFLAILLCLLLLIIIIIINNNNKLYLYSTFHAKECSSKCFTANTLRAQGAGAGFLLAILLCLARVGYKQCMLYCEG